MGIGLVFKFFVEEEFKVGMFVIVVNGVCIVSGNGYYLVVLSGCELYLFFV